MRRTLRLRSTSLFNKVYREGQSVANRDLVLYYLGEPGEATRVGFSVSRKIGTAVVRNKTRRRLREIVASMEDGLSPGYLLVFVVRQPAADQSFQELRDSAIQLLGRAGVLRETQ